MRMIHLIVPVILFFITGDIFAQNILGQLAVDSLQQNTFIIRSKEQSGIIFISEVPDLQFESSRKIYAVSQRGDSEWRMKVEPGRQIITIRAPGYQPIKTGIINLQAKMAYSIKVSQVRPASGTLIINSKPPAADVKINGVSIKSITPVQLDEVLPGTLNLEVGKDLFHPAYKTVEVKSNEVTEWNVELTQSAVSVHISFEDEDLEDVAILIDGELKGVAPGEIFLEPGTYKLLLQKPGYSYVEKAINIELGRQQVRMKEELISLHQPVYKQWWFYAGSALLVGGAAILIGSGGDEQKDPLSSSPPAFPGTE